MSTPPVSFPRQHARTRRFSLGVPRAITTGVGPLGPTVLFLRTDAGDDPVTHLWRYDPVTGATQKLVDARGLEGAEAELPAEERARRERAREQAGGIVGYATDRGLTLAAFAVAGQLHTVDLATGELAVHSTAPGVFDPRPSPDGRHVAYHAGGALRVVELPDGPGTPGRDRVLVEEPEVSWGRAEFVAAEEMGRSRGFWWAHDSRSLVVARVDERGVPVWHIADPAQPWMPPVEHRYPAAGTTNARVELWVIGPDGDRRRIDWEATGDEYLGVVDVDVAGVTLLTQSRDQRTARIGRVDLEDGGYQQVRSWTDPAWVELVPGSPAWWGERLLTVEDRTEVGDAEVGTRTLCLDGEPIGPPGLQVRELVAVQPVAPAVAADGADGADGAGGDTADEVRVTLLASPADDATRIDVVVARIGSDGTPIDVRTTASLPPGVRRMVTPASPADRDAAPAVLVTHELTSPRARVQVLPAGSADLADLADLAGDDGGVGRGRLPVVSDEPVLRATPRLLRLGARGLHAALLLPRDADDGPLPVLLDPYGGPHAQRVLASNAAFLAPQWLADQGFAVLVTDGRGSPGRGPVFERAIHGDLAAPVLDDQIEALQAAAALEPRLDLDRVAIRGWSFGGYLAALAVLRRPDVFRAGIAGAPVTDWRLYDTHYTERYLGEPMTDPGAYARSSLIDAEGALLGAVEWDEHDPPSLLIIHGLADDNVVAAHALRLSSALLADGRPHTFLPLSGVTHMTPQEVVAEQLLVQQVRFLHASLR